MTQGSYLVWYFVTVVYRKLTNIICLSVHPCTTVIQAPIQHYIFSLYRPTCDTVQLNNRPKFHDLESISLECTWDFFYLMTLCINQNVFLLSVRWVFLFQETFPLFSSTSICIIYIKQSGCIYVIITYILCMYRIHTYVFTYMHISTKI